MSARKVMRGRGAGLGPGRRPRRRSGGGGKKGGGISCPFSLPSIPVALARGVLAAWTIRSLEASR